MFRFPCLQTILLVLSLAAQAAAADKPNILFLFADDQRADTIAAYGNQVIQTPNIDSIARSGFRFTNAYCMGSMQGAVCVPSRAMVNSGRNLFEISDNEQLKGIPTLGEVLQTNGYTTFGTGKWHNGAESTKRSFTEGASIFLGGMHDHTKVPIVDLVDGEISESRVGQKFSNSLFADAAVEFLAKRDGSQPFYAYVAFTAPHDPRQFPDDMQDRYPADTMPLPENFLPQHPFFNGWMTGRDETLAPWPRTKTIIRHQLADYYRLISDMDRQIGRILDALNQSGHAENTIIVYSADHGLALGSHGLLGKQSVYEHSMKAPLFFSGKGIPAGSSDALAYLLDIPTTIWSLSETTAPAGVSGKDLSKLWTQSDSEAVREDLLLAYEKYMRGLRWKNWKLIRYTHINKTQLFDLSHDPYELHDLSADTDHETLVTELTTRMQAAQSRFGDTQALSSEPPQSAEIDLTGRERKPDAHQPAWIVTKYFDLEGWNWRDE